MKMELNVHTYFFPVQPGMFFPTSGEDYLSHEKTVCACVCVCLCKCERQIKKRIRLLGTISTYLCGQYGEYYLVT